MVWETLQEPMYLILAIMALITAVSGLLLLNGLFKKKIEDLFNDAHFFTFFFLTWGYILFALGELCWYLIFKVFNETSSTGMSDFYWVAGSILMILSFAVLSVGFYKRYSQTHKFASLITIGIIFLAGIFIYLYSTISPSGSAGETFLTYYYPLSSGLILLLSTSIILYYKNLNHFGKKLILLFFASICFFIGDLLYVSLGDAYSLMGVVSDGIYLLAYLLSTIALLSLMLKTNSASDES